MDSEVKTETQRKVAPLLESLKDKSPATRQRALEELASSGASAEDITEPILALFTDKSPAVRQAAMDAVEKVNPALHKPILTIMVDRNASNKALAINELGNMGGTAKPAVPTLLRLYHNQSGEYGAVLLTALNSIDPENKDFQSLVIAEMVRPQTAGRRKGGSDDVRFKALQIAAELVKTNKIEAAKLMKPLRATLSTPYKMVAINILGDMGPEAKDALPELRQLKIDPIEAVRDAAAEAVKKIE